MFAPIHASYAECKQGLVVLLDVVVRSLVVAPKKKKKKKSRLKGVPGVAAKRKEQFKPTSIQWE